MRLTEQPSKYDNLEKMSVKELITNINNEDKLVALAIEKVLPDLEKLITAIENQLRNGGRMFYVGCGTGGRLSVLDAIELPNTYGIEHDKIICILAGGVERVLFYFIKYYIFGFCAWESKYNIIQRARFLCTVFTCYNEAFFTVSCKKRHIIFDTILAENYVNRHKKIHIHGNLVSLKRRCTHGKEL